MFPLPRHRPPALWCGPDGRDTAAGGREGGCVLHARVHPGLTHNPERVSRLDAPVGTVRSLSPAAPAESPSNGG